MLQKRIYFVLQQLEETGRLGSYPVGVTVDSDSLVAFFEVLAENFSSNEALLALIDNIAGGNMRMALEFVTSFIGSGHIDTGKILEIKRQTGRYTIPIHEFLRSLLLGDSVYYDPEASPISNLFHITQPDGREHFLVALLLTHIQAEGEKLGQEGYVATDDVFRFAQGLGYTEEQVSAGLGYAVHKRLVDGAPRYSGERARIHYRITTVGAYSVRILVAYFAYVDAVLVDTPIVDGSYRKLLDDVHSLPDRVRRAEYFRVYLDRQWSLMYDERLPWRWPDTSERLSEDIRRVGRRADPETWGWSR